MQEKSQESGITEAQSVPTNAVTQIYTQGTAAAATDLLNTTPAVMCGTQVSNSKLMQIPEGMDLDKAWIEYKTRPTDERRNALIQVYMPLITSTAVYIAKKLPPSADLEEADFVSYGVLGMMNAIEAFDLSRRLKFTSFCKFRVRGAMLDALREMDWVPKSWRYNDSKVKAAKQKIIDRGKPLTEEAIRKELDMTARQYKELQRNLDNIPTMRSLSDNQFETNSGRVVSPAHMIPNKKAIPENQIAEESETMKVLMKGLSIQERIIIILYYIEEKTMKEIGAHLDVSESRISQLHTAIMRHIKDRIQNADVSPVNGLADLIREKVNLRGLLLKEESGPADEFIATVAKRLKIGEILDAPKSENEQTINKILQNVAKELGVEMAEPIYRT